jgi:hypothetical protein
MRIVIPWLVTFLFCFLVFLFGKRLQRKEREHRKLRSRLRDSEPSVSAFDATHPNQAEDKASYIKKDQVAIGRIN